MQVLLSSAMIKSGARRRSRGSGNGSYLAEIGKLNDDTEEETGGQHSLQYQPLSRPLAGFELTDVTNNTGSEWNCKPKSGKWKNRKSGSVRSAG
jgi:hypothetical protein